ncbi:MAG TPA: FAD-dependent oxidoreductase [Chromatiales bacterium]|nr:FAD-dependent oxidoreductase [Thiotrichales bacterium]HIP68083.1 FAD-dependent oxidoreductase [Chromatiales bacterium]
MKNKIIDIVVIGGGIQGAGVAQAAAAAGYQVTLLEQSSLAAGSSSKSSKLIHGGLRYLENLDIKLVRESLHERELLLKNAPELVHRIPFHIPVYHRTSRKPWLIRTGLSLYTILAGLSQSVRFRSLPENEWAQLDGLKTDGLKKVFQYWDAQTDDRKLTEAVMHSAKEMGAEFLCPTTFMKGEKNETGYKIHYKTGDKTNQLQARVVINAAGPWALSVAKQFTPELPVIAVENIQGAHIELPGLLEKGCYYLEVPEDKRAVFAMPWHDKTLFGTTENQYTGDPAKVSPLQQELDYLLQTYQFYFPERRAEILDAWAGIRVLPTANGSSFKRSRETHLVTDSEERPTAVSIFGGKLTVYRATAEQLMRVIQKSLPQKTAKADTRNLKLS